MQRAIFLLSFAAALALPSLASATEPSPDPVPEPTIESLAAQPRAPALGPMPTPAEIDRANRIWRGVGIGYDVGFWGRAHFAQTLKVDIPFGWRIGQFLGARVRGTMVYADSGPGPDSVFDPVFNHGLELFGRSPVMLGVLRVYGGGGAWVGIRLDPPTPMRLDPSNMDQRYAMGGGGHLGVEFKLTDRASVQFEVGGQSPGHALGYDGGASVMSGIMIYTGRPKPR
ncbi:hypothetical protein DB30_00314 [Enhygromyxa salina]|uniref:Outer membrane protein beta-barrel domain-containing protein n=1 Tax=Enhygromyxa salina TaxID=215803 RepID=A0A0C1ZMC5_9BACT|nr:hypothetical protein [Enhygromyxa salina]KIG18629.1 hypothetical protein DB30_00314 [Enhygromyxa salina]